MQLAAKITNQYIYISNERIQVIKNSKLLKCYAVKYGKTSRMGKEGSGLNSPSLIRPLRGSLYSSCKNLRIKKQDSKLASLQINKIEPQGFGHLRSYSNLFSIQPSKIPQIKFVVFNEYLIIKNFKT